MASTTASTSHIISNMNMGADAAGVDLKLFGDTTGKYWLWDASANAVVSYGGLTVGVDDTGYDVKFFGASSGTYWLWDEDADTMHIAEGKFTMTTATETATDPGRHIYLQRTYTGAASSAGLTGIEVRSTFNGSANSTSMEVKGGEFKARHTNSNTKNVGTFKGVIGNCDSKTGAKTITSAWAVEGQIDCGTGSTITTAAGCRVAYNEDGTVTNAYGIYVDGTSVWDVGVMITDSKATTGIDVGTSTTGIEFGGTYATSAINMQAATPNTSDDDKSLIRIGGYDNALALSSAITQNTFIQSIHIDSQANPGSALWLVGSYNKIKVTSADQANTQAVPVMIRGDIGKPIASFYGVQSHVKFSGTGDCSAEVIALSAQTYGTAATGTGYHWGVKSDLRATNTPSGAGHTSACFFGVGTVSCSCGLYIEPLSGKTMYSGVYLHAAGSMTNAIEIGGAANVTYLFKFNAASSVIVSDTSSLPGNATHKIKCQVGSTTFYLIGVADF